MPEFHNRLDNIIWLNALTTEVVAQIVDKFIVELQTQLDEKEYQLKLAMWHVNGFVLKVMIS